MFTWMSKEDLLVVVLDAEVAVAGGLCPPLHPLVGRCSVLVHDSQLRLPEFSYMKQHHPVTSLTACQPARSVYLSILVKLHDIHS